MIASVDIARLREAMAMAMPRYCEAVRDSCSGQSGVGAEGTWGQLGPPVWNNPNYVYLLRHSSVSALTKIKNRRAPFRAAVPRVASLWRLPPCGSRQTGPAR